MHHFLIISLHFTIVRYLRVYGKNALWWSVFLPYFLTPSLPYSPRDLKIMLVTWSQSQWEYLYLDICKHYILVGFFPTKIWLDTPEWDCNVSFLGINSIAMVHPSSCWGEHGSMCWVTASISLHCWVTMMSRTCALQPQSTDPHWTCGLKKN